jgi:hypothetical protein
MSFRPVLSGISPPAIISVKDGVATRSSIFPERFRYSIDLSLMLIGEDELNPAETAAPIMSISNRPNKMTDAQMAAIEPKKDTKKRFNILCGG